MKKKERVEVPCGTHRNGKRKYVIGTVIARDKHGLFITVRTDNNEELWVPAQLARSIHENKLAELPTGQEETGAVQMPGLRIDTPDPEDFVGSSSFVIDRSRPIRVLKNMARHRHLGDGDEGDPLRSDADV